ncbi:50S ribosomal protein L21e [Candidatus Methanoperedenaceae archaeon GB50]|nr:MAG: 50S ribosomal protein L21e [Thermotoga sp.]CAD7774539.1 50S ribosomal protein L21e [Candidatus Methanoperedenaceae archaeon GB37]CAD7774658.1 50S ribosomal protein L21e [Candidatus Methanoperedenaceae archaeon GB50]CAD7778930.1 MAG: 50S ribosomal protein L21e [Candidatus Methanoperedenaceae archaeon GB50]
MPKSHGTRRKTRYKLKKKNRARGISPVSKSIQEFKVGDRVHIIIDPSIHHGMPNPKFHGKTGAIAGRRGRGYVVNVRDGRSIKEIIVFPEHLARQVFR